jgi:hypothetical protein
MMPMPLSSHQSYVGQSGLEFIGSGIGLDIIHNGRIRPTHEDDNEDFSAFFNADREFDYPD